jgi:hypothetical protein
MRILLVPVTAAFAAFTGWVILRLGYFGCWKQLLATPLGWQVTADITIALFLVLSWMRRDARATGRSYWPYVAVTLGLGSLGPLLYLVLRPARATSAPARAIAAAGEGA